MAGEPGVHLPEVDRQPGRPVAVSVSTRLAGRCWSGSGGRVRTSRAPLAAALSFSLALVPALGFFNVYPFRYSFVADHFQYLASLGPIALCCRWRGNAVDPIAVRAALGPRRRGRTRRRAAGGADVATEPRLRRRGNALPGHDRAESVLLDGAQQPRGAEAPRLGGRGDGSPHRGLARQPGLRRGPRQHGTGPPDVRASRGGCDGTPRCAAPRTHLRRSAQQPGDGAAEARATGRGRRRVPRGHPPPAASVRRPT